jgi:hypothetical protein
MQNSSLNPNVFRTGARKPLIVESQLQQQQQHTTPQMFLVQQSMNLENPTPNLDAKPDTAVGDLATLQAQQAAQAKEAELREEEDEITKADQMYSVRSYIKKALTTSTLHRLGSVFENESLPLKIILGMAFLASTGFCIYEIVKAIIAYASYANLTVGSIFYEVPAEFPGSCY